MIKNSTAVIKGQDARHIAKVLRKNKGDEILFADGRGKDYQSVIKALSKDKVIVEITTTNKSKFESPVKISFCQGMLKDKKMDTLVRHLTELGISSWTPFFCERSIPKPDKQKIASRILRWEKISIEALKQCNRSMVPGIHPPVTFTEILNQSSQFDLKVMFWEEASTPLNELKNKNDTIQSICILIGPEGGFSRKEAGLAEKAGFKICSLGPRILRAETASLTACSLIQHYFGDI